jgi:hypothetical protein
MTGQQPTPPVQQATPRQRCALLLRTAVLALLTTTVLVALYYLLPMDRGFDADTVLLLIVYLAALVAILTWRLRGLFRSDYPGLRAVETLALVVPLYLLLFATAQMLLDFILLGFGVRVFLSAVNLARERRALKLGVSQ